MASKLKFAVVAALGATCLTTWADTIYQANDPSITAVYDAASSPTGQIGDEVDAAYAGWQFTGISVKYNANYNMPGGLKFDIYSNSGVNGIPDKSNPLFEITTDVKAGNNVLSIAYNQGDFFLPQNFTYTLTFAGLGGGNDAGIFLGGPSTSPAYPWGTPLSTSFNDVWTATGPGASDWALNQVNGNFANLNAVVTANAPEPGTIALGLVGAATIGFAAYRRQRK